MNVLAVTVGCIVAALVGGIVSMRMWERRAIDAAVQLTKVCQQGSNREIVATYGVIAERAPQVPAGKVYFSGTTVEPLEHWGRVQVRMAIQGGAGKTWIAKSNWDARRSVPKLLDLSVEQVTN